MTGHGCPDPNKSKRTDFPPLSSDLRPSGQERVRCGVPVGTVGEFDLSPNRFICLNFVKLGSVVCVSCSISERQQSPLVGVFKEKKVHCNSPQ